MVVSHPLPQPPPTWEEGFSLPLLPQQRVKSAKKDAGTVGGFHSPELPQPSREEETQLVDLGRTPERPGERSTGLIWEERG